MTMPMDCQQQHQHQQQHHQQQQQQLQHQQLHQQSQLHVRDELLNKGLSNSILYPAALANLPQEVLLNLVQSGHLQIQEQGKFHIKLSSHQFSCGHARLVEIFRY